MFFGLQVSSNKNKAEYINLGETLKLGQAVLQPTKDGASEPVSLMVEIGDEEFILCVIDGKHGWTCPLDVMFAPDTKIKFFVRGKGKVHITGYKLEDEMPEMSCSSDDDSLNEECDLKARKKPTKLNGTSKGSAQKKTNGKTILDAELGDKSSSDDLDFSDSEESSGNESSDDEDHEDEEGDDEDDDQESIGLDDEDEDDDDDDIDHDDDDDDEDETTMWTEDMDSDDG